MSHLWAVEMCEPHGVLSLDDFFHIKAFLRDSLGSNLGVLMKIE